MGNLFSNVDKDPVVPIDTDRITYASLSEVDVLQGNYGWGNDTAARARGELNTITLNYDGKGGFGPNDHRSEAQIQRDHDNRERYINNASDSTPWRPTRFGDRTFGRVAYGVGNIRVAQVQTRQGGQENGNDVTGYADAGILGGMSTADTFDNSELRVNNILYTGRGSDEFILSGKFRPLLDTDGNRLKSIHEGGDVYYDDRDTILTTHKKLTDAESRKAELYHDKDISAYSIAYWNELMINHTNEYSNLCSQRWLTEKDKQTNMSCDEAQQRAYAWETANSGVCADMDLIPIPGVGEVCRGIAAGDSDKKSSPIDDRRAGYYHYLTQYNKQDIGIDAAFDVPFLLLDGTAGKVLGKFGEKSYAHFEQRIIEQELAGKFTSEVEMTERGVDAVLTKDASKGIEEARLAARNRLAEQQTDDFVKEQEAARAEKVAEREEEDLAARNRLAKQQTEDFVKEQEATRAEKVAVREEEDLARVPGIGVPLITVPILTPKHHTPPPLPPDDTSIPTTPTTRKRVHHTSDWVDSHDASVGVGSEDKFPGLLTLVILTGGLYISYRIIRHELA